MATGDQITIEVIRPPAKDNFGDTLPGTGLTFPISGCEFAPGPSIENLVAANQIKTDGAVYAPPGVDVRPADQVRVRGIVYDVVGRPQDWGSAGLVILLREVTG